VQICIHNKNIEWHNLSGKSKCCRKLKKILNFIGNLEYWKFVQNHEKNFSFKTQKIVLEKHCIFLATLKIYLIIFYEHRRHRMILSYKFYKKISEGKFNFKSKF